MSRAIPAWSTRSPARRPARHEIHLDLARLGYCDLAVLHIVGWDEAPGLTIAAG